MAVTVSDLDPILKEFYQGPIIEALNSQLEMVQLFTKTTLDWQGRRVIIPVHLSRNSGTDFLAESAELPTAGKQDYVNLDVRAKYLYGRFRLTGQSIASAKTTANSFATYVQSEMDRLVTDVKVKANQAMYTGNGWVGFIWRRKNVGQNNLEVFNFSGNKDHVRALQTTARGGSGAAVTDILSCDVIRLDTYSSAYEGNGTMVISELVGGVYTGVGASDTSISLVAMATAAGTGDLYLAGGGGSFPSNTALRANVPAAIRVKASGAHSVAGGNQVFTANTGAAFNITSVVDNEQMGIYGNLCKQVHFGIDRNLTSTTAAGAVGTAQASIARPVEGGNHELRAAAIETVPATTAGPADVAAAEIDFERMQAMLDQILVLGGDNPDCIYMHPIMRQKYAAALLWTASSANAGNLYKDVNAAPGRGDAGFSGYAFAGIPVKVSRHCGKGLALFLNTRTWTITELQSFGMANMDGNILSRRPNYDEWEGFVRWYYDLVCKEPNRNAILVGIAFNA